MVEAYVLIQVEPGTSLPLTKELSGVKGVVSVDDVVGPYDIVARAEATSLDSLARLVVSEIQACEGVTRTLVCAVPNSAP
jgi:DNA-binding Lrp family transcriptional regulator